LLIKEIDATIVLLYHVIKSLMNYIWKKIYQNILKLGIIYSIT